MIRFGFSVSPTCDAGGPTFSSSAAWGVASVAGAEDWRYLLIEDPLPAGAETIADDSLYPLEKRRIRPWGGRQEFRDDRAVFFQDRLPGGRVEFWYLLKIVTPGTFRAMPAQVTPMYVPDVSASTTPTSVTVAAATAGAGQ